MGIKRRDFISNTIKAGALTAGGLSILPKAFASEMTAQRLNYDMVAVMNGSPESLVDASLNAIGGLKTIISPNQTVVIKPNIGWDAPPERAANTNPLVVKQLVKRAKEAGAKKVMVFDHTCNNWIKSYQNSGIEKAVKDAGGQMVPGNSATYYQDIEIKNGKVLKKAKVHELILESDVFINVPVLKNHGGATMTIAMKNLMGIIWDRRFWHDNDLHQCIADFATWYRKPDLNIVDAYNVMMKNGPRGVSVNDVRNMKAMLLSEDMVTIDAAATKLWGREPETVGYIPKANNMGVGKMNLEGLNVKKIKL
jgi:uncharacterized protein (DUF362 family)